MLRLLIVDDHPLIRHGLRQILTNTGDIEVVAEAASGTEAMRLLRTHAIDVVLLDITMPDRNGIDVLKQIRREYGKLPVLMLTMHAEDEFGVRALKAGASGYLTKDSAHGQLVKAIRQVAGGRKYLTATLAEEIAQRIGDDLETPPHETLSDREFQTLRLIAAGKSLSEIAATLSLSPKTVSVYRARLLEKLKLRNNAELMRYAMQNRLVGWHDDRIPTS
ncbi:MAG TPA: response regulator transcription factor [Burkholderiales bacterium]|nr:response regulator transcription factor [Burkholderiales bacterium]